jgi:hypothetical protein
MQADVRVHDVTREDQRFDTVVFKNAGDPKVEAHNLKKPHQIQESVQIKSNSSRYVKKKGGYYREVDQIGNMAMMGGVDAAECHAGSERNQEEQPHLHFHPIERDALGPLRVLPEKSTDQYEQRYSIQSDVNAQPQVPVVGHVVAEHRQQQPYSEPEHDFFSVHQDLLNYRGNRDALSEFRKLVYWCILEAALCGEVGDRPSFDHRPATPNPFEFGQNRALPAKTCF